MRSAKKNDLPNALKDGSELSELLSTIIGSRSKLSHRALAKRLSVSSGYVSLILKGHKIPSDEMLIKIGAALNLNEVTLTKILAASQKVRLKKKNGNISLPTASLVATRIPTETEIDVRPRSNEKNLEFWSDFFQNHELMIASSVLGLDVEKKNLQWFSKIMGSSMENSEKMLKILVDLGLASVKETDDGDIFINGTTTPTSFLNISSATRKKLMKSFMKVVRESLDVQPDDLPQRGMTLKLNPSQIPELKAITDEFVMKVQALSTTPGPKTKIYCLQLATIDWEVTSALK